MDQATVLQAISKGVVTLTLNRPQVLNALSSQLVGELCAAIAQADANPDVRVLVITGQGKAFAAGADIGEMAGKPFAQVLGEDMFGGLNKAFANCRKPVIAAVNGYALGGGCEIAMLCDVVVAAEQAKFGQPEIKLGTIPGVGGTQRLLHAVGKAMAMDMVLSGRMISATEAERCGLVARVVLGDGVLQEAQTLAQEVAGYSQPAVKMAKEAVNQALETSLSQGLLFEKRLFHSTFALKDQREGMRAFVEKRPPDFKDG